MDMKDGKDSLGEGRPWKNASDEFGWERCG